MNVDNVVWIIVNPIWIYHCHKSKQILYWFPGSFCTGRTDGYYINPASCTSFYQCANGMNNLLQCTKGTYYDDVNNICNWPTNLSASRQAACDFEISNISTYNLGKGCMAKRSRFNIPLIDPGFHFNFDKLWSVELQIIKDYKSNHIFI